MTSSAYAAETPLYAASRIFGAVIFTLVLLVGISACVHLVTAREPSIAPARPVGFNIDSRGIVSMAMEQAVR
jgi:Ca2+/Na+ antiporter